MNIVKIILLILIPLALFSFAGYAIADIEGIYFGTLLSLILIFGIYWFCDSVVLKLCKAELLTVYHAPTLFRTVEALSKEAHVPMPKIYAISNHTPNALAVGRTPQHGGIVLTDGILKNAQQSDLRSAIAHQLAHIKRRDTLVGGVAAVIAAMLGMATKSAQHASSSEISGTTALAKLTDFTLRGVRLMLVPVAATFVQLLTGERSEFHADEQGAAITRDPLAMANAIRTMEKAKYAKPMSVVPAVAHLFMVNPLFTGFIARLFVTHPSMEQRIARLKSLQIQAPPSTNTSLSRVR